MEQLLLFIYLYFIDDNWQRFDMSHIYWIWIRCVWKRVYRVTKGGDWEFRKRLWFEEWSSRYKQQTLLESNSCVLFNRSTLVENGSQWFPFWDPFHIPMPWMDFILSFSNRLPRTSTAKWGLTHEHWLCLLFRICWKVKLPRMYPYRSVMPMYYLLYKKRTQVQ